MEINLIFGEDYTTRSQPNFANQSVGQSIVQ